MNFLQSSGSSFLSRLPAPSQTHEFKSRQSMATPINKMDHVVESMSPPASASVEPSTSRLIRPSPSAAAVVPPPAQSLPQPEPSDSESDEGDMQGF